MAREKEEAANASKRAARRLRRSAERAAGRGDADGVAESDDDNEAESDDVRERLEKLEAMEHGEVDWDDDDVYRQPRLGPVLVVGRPPGVGACGATRQGMHHATERAQRANVGG